SPQAPQPPPQAAPHSAENPSPPLCIWVFPAAEDLPFENPSAQEKMTAETAHRPPRRLQNPNISLRVHYSLRIGDGRRKAAALSIRTKQDKSCSGSKVLCIGNERSLRKRRGSRAERRSKIQRKEKAKGKAKAKAPFFLEICLTAVVAAAGMAGISIIVVVVVGFLHILAFVLAIGAEMRRSTVRRFYFSCSCSF
ncbi:hypothetical protein GW17_00000995, partial [Ensete ventricosum]